MAWKGVHITRPARLSVKRSQLSVEQEEGEVTVPLEDIGWLVIDEPRVTLSVSLIAACAEAGIAVVTTDARHMPSALTLPFNQHYRTSGVVADQLAASAALKKRMWQALVRTKILNQAAALERRRIPSAPPLKEMAGRVRSGDPENIEAQAARAYWSALFKDFVRSDETDVRNAALNYGYAVLRGCVARALVGVGLQPAIGLHHTSVANSFNLADDIIEPFRPTVDLTVAVLLEDRSPSDSLSREHRQSLARIPLDNVLLEGAQLSVLHAAEAVAQSLARAFEEGAPSALQLPALPSAQSDLPGLLQ